MPNIGLELKTPMFYWLSQQVAQYYLLLSQICPSLFLDSWQFLKDQIVIYYNKFFQIFSSVTPDNKYWDFWLSLCVLGISYTT